MSITIREKKLKSGKKSLYLDIYKNGKRRYEFLKLYLTGNKDEDKQTRALAENIKAKKQLEIAHNSHGFTAPFNKKANFIKYFENDKDSFNTSTRQQYANVLKKLKAYAGDSVQFGAVDRQFCKGFKENLLSEMNTSTARIYFAMFKAVLNRAVKAEIIPENPAKKVKGIKVKKGRKIKYLTKKELQKLAKADCPWPEVKAAFMFSCNTGLRWSDISTLGPGSIVDQQIEIRQTKTSGAEYLPLSKQALEILEGRETDPFFDLPTNSYANDIVKIWANNAGLKRWKKITDEDGNVVQEPLIYHTSRHTFAVQMLSSGCGIYTLKELMGHESVKSTEVYAQVLNETKKNAISNLKL